ncbi:MAG: ComF family protein, partial [Oscillospiraceae bacterium]|nr:ComF family protein [Oscillospiraceae bacterium]
MDRSEIYRKYRKIISLVFPNICPFCERIIGADEYWCESCCKFLPYVKKPLVPPENITRFYACCYYIQRARMAVYTMKFGGKAYAVDAFAQMMQRLISDELKNTDMLVPVPSSFQSFIGLGFSPAEMIAKRISWNKNIPSVKAIKARRGKIAQKGLSMKRRAENAKNSFYLDKSADLRGKKVVLIDDVCTTGSTLSACSELLLGA